MAVEKKLSAYFIKNDVKRQIHLDPSRDAETIYLSCCADLPANQSIVVLAFETFNNLRTLIRWIDTNLHAKQSAGCR